MLIGESQCFVVTRWNSHEKCERRVVARPAGGPEDGACRGTRVEPLGFEVARHEK